MFKETSNQKFIFGSRKERKPAWPDGQDKKRRVRKELLTCKIIFAAFAWNKFMKRPDILCFQKVN